MQMLRQKPDSSHALRLQARGERVRQMSTIIHKLSYVINSFTKVDGSKIPKILST